MMWVTLQTSLLKTNTSASAVKCWSVFQKLQNGNDFLKIAVDWRCAPLSACPKWETTIQERRWSVRKNRTLQNGSSWHQPSGRADTDSLFRIFRHQSSPDHCKLVISTSIAPFPEQSPPHQILRHRQWKTWRRPLNGQRHVSFYSEVLSQA